jgi:hypothetical protein
LAGVDIEKKEAADIDQPQPFRKPGQVKYLRVSVGE